MAARQTERPPHEGRLKQETSFFSWSSCLKARLHATLNLHTAVPLGVQDSSVSYTDWDHGFASLHHACLKGCT